MQKPNHAPEAFLDVELPWTKLIRSDSQLARSSAFQERGQREADQPYSSLRMGRPPRPPSTASTMLASAMARNGRPPRPPSIDRAPGPSWITVPYVENAALTQLLAGPDPSAVREASTLLDQAESISSDIIPSQDSSCAGEASNRIFDDTMPSKGSDTHFLGVCTPCVFFHTDRCLRGVSCECCHYEHDGVKRPGRSRRKKTTRMSM